MKLVHLHDVVAQIAATIDKNPDDPYLATPEFRDSKNLAVIKQLIGAAHLPGSVPSWRALQGKLGRMKRLNVFDVAGIPRIKHCKEVIFFARLSHSL